MARNKRRNRRKPGPSRSSAVVASGLNSHLVQDNTSLATASGLIVYQADHAPQRMSNTPPTRVPRNIRNQIFWTRQNVEVGGFSTSTTVETFNAWAFYFVDVPDFTAFSGIFDAYAIVWVEISFIPTGETTYTQTGLMATVIDYDDNTVPGSFVSMEEYSTFQLSKGTIGQVRGLAPRISGALVNNAGTTVAGNSTRAWCDIATASSVPHYGVKVANRVTSTAIPINVRATYYIALKNTR